MRRKTQRVFIITLPYRTAWVGVAMGTLATGSVFTVAAVHSKSQISATSMLIALGISFLAVVNIGVARRQLWKMRRDMEYARNSWAKGMVDDDVIDYAVLPKNGDAVSLPKTSRFLKEVK